MAKRPKFYSKLIVFTLQLLIIVWSPQFIAQSNTPKDTIRMNDSSMDQIVRYSAKDSIYTDVKAKKVFLFGDAKVETDEVKMHAGFIAIDLEKNELFATYRYDKDSNRTEYPAFKSENEEINAAAIRYNFDTRKGYIEEVALKQEEIYLYMGVAKRQTNEDIHFKDGVFTTCNLKEPHYHFHLSKAVMIPNERIVTGPMNLYVAGIPTPLGLPFSILPQQKERTHGLLFPQFVPVSNYGFGVQDLGYYLPINDQLNVSLYTNIFSRGSWALRAKSDYKKRYGYNGSIDLSFQQFRSGFPFNTSSNKTTIIWRHSTDPKANPNWAFGSNVNFISDNTSKNYLDPLNPQYFNNAFTSDIFLNRFFPGKPLNIGTKASMRQNAALGTSAITAPSLNINLTRIFPFKNLVRGTTGLRGAISRIGLSYNGEIQNKGQVKNEELKLDSIQNWKNAFMNGANNTITIQTTTSFYKNAIKLTPSLSLNNKINFQQIRKSYDTLSNSTFTDTIQETGIANDITFNLQLTTVLYSYYKFVGKRKALLRHIATPSISVRYAPQLNTLLTDNVGINQTPLTYSPFENSLYSSRAYSTGGSIDFGINNTFELKRLVHKDSTSFQKTKLIDALSISSRYDLALDSFNLSDFSLNLRISPITALNFVATSQFSPYAWDTTTNQRIASYAISNSQGLGRFTFANFSTTYTFTSSENRKELEKSSQQTTTDWNPAYAQFQLHPEYWIDYSIPWKISISHIYALTLATKTTFPAENYSSTHAVGIVGDVSFTQNWKFTGDAKIDLKTSQMVNLRIGLNRNLHCWNLAFNWTPIGGNKSFLITLRNSSSIFKDAKIDLRKPPAF